MQYSPEILAQAYGSGSFDSSIYQGSLAGSGSRSGSNTGGMSGSNTGGGNTTSKGSKGATTQSSSGASLSNTGFDLALIITFACIIALAALVIRFWKKPKVTKH